ncbi:hypothetical protein RJ640_015404 [Escallonia rubra]|uniref:Exonuclease 1 n=1 Tax=Escallonia rubra TaxID=112253 RepID=A0AA88QJK0_9ASTE|nr:hypothetical protein RJ640_015404 [Escallonia rubra]
MGIKDLLRFMKPYVEPIHIKKYAGKRVGIDAYSWLHKGGNVLVTLQYRRRKGNHDLAMAKLEEGNVNAAIELFQRAINITPLMAHQLIQILKSENIEFVVAPYEADAQLAYLSGIEAEKGGIVAVISEDSDLLAYGCPAVVFKMDRHGNGEEIVLDKVFDPARVPSLGNLNKELFTGMCVLAGCDFLPSVPGIGPSKAYSLVSKYRNLDRVLSILKFAKGNQMPEDYVKSFKEAVAAFQHARIYDADSRRLKHIKPLPEALSQLLDEDLDFLGLELPPSIAAAIAEGMLDPCTMEAYNHFPTSGTCVNPTTSSQASDKLPTHELKGENMHEMPFYLFPDCSKSDNFRRIYGYACDNQGVSLMTRFFFFIDMPAWEQDTVSEERKQKSALAKRKYLNEAVALCELALPVEPEASKQNKAVPAKNPALVPDNNPFKRRKPGEAQLERTKCDSEEVSAQVEQTECDTEQVSVLTEVENMEMPCVTPESQKSVDSEPVKISEGKTKCTSGEKLKKSDCSSLAKKKSSILNFFSRVQF